MRGPSPWNDDLDARLTSDWAAGFNTAEIGRRMGISKNSVIGRAHRLQLPSRGSPINLAASESWTDAEDAFMCGNYGLFTAAEIGLRMKRSVHAISYRAKFLGLVAKPCAKQTGQRVSPSAQPWAGRGASSSPRQSRPANQSRPRAGEPGAAADTARHASLDLPEADTTPPRVFFGTECKYPLYGDERPVVPRFCAEPVRDNAKGCASPYCAAHYAVCYDLQKKRPTHPARATWLKNGGVVWVRGDE